MSQILSIIFADSGASQYFLIFSIKKIEAFQSKILEKGGHSEFQKFNAGFTEDFSFD